MSKVKLVLLSVVAILSLGAMLASSASAINFEYKVNGAKLEAGKTKEFTVTSDGHNFDLHSTLSGAAVLLLSHEVSVKSGAKIIGGIPGTNEETVIFKGVTVDNPANCGVLQSGGSAGEIKTQPLKTEIVEGAASEKGNSEVDILFTPLTGTTFTTFELTGTSCLVKGTVAPVSGTVLALALPQGTEAVNGDLDFEANTKEYHNHAGEFKKAGLFFASTNVATLTGLSLVLLVSGEKFGAF